MSDGRDDKASHTVVRRKLIIEFDDNDTELAFTHRLADMRARYPMWRIAATTTSVPWAKSRLAPAPPESAFGSTKEEQIRQYLRSLPSEKEAEILPDHQTEADGDHAAAEVHRSGSQHGVGSGNLVGEAPVALYRGLRVRCMCPPFGGRDGTVETWRGDNVLVRVPRFACHGLRVLTAGFAATEESSEEGENVEEWWYNRSDLRVIPVHCGCTASLHFDVLRKGLFAAVEALRRFGVSDYPEDTKVALLHL